MIHGRDVTERVPHARIEQQVAEGEAREGGPMLQLTGSPRGRSAPAGTRRTSCSPCRGGRVLLNLGIESATSTDFWSRREGR
jgi:hypothetical protein